MYSTPATFTSQLVGNSTVTKTAAKMVTAMAALMTTVQLIFVWTGICNSELRCASVVVSNVFCVASAHELIFRVLPEHCCKQ